MYFVDKKERKKLDDDDEEDALWFSLPQHPALPFQNGGLYINEIIKGNCSFYPLYNGFWRLTFDHGGS
jgi:hypothetical protein